MRIRYVWLLIFGISFSASSQINRYFVSFKDKSNSPYTISDPSKFLSQKSIARREKQNIPIISEDLPVSSSYVQQVKATGAKVFFTSKWWNGLLVQADNATLSMINSLPFVLKTEMVAPGSKLIGGRNTQIDKNNKVESVLESSDFQLIQLAMDRMHAEGFRGEGIDIAQFDSGWQGVNSSAPFQPLFLEGRLKGTFNFVKNVSDVYTDDDHGTEVLSVMAAYSPGIFTGGAYKANYYLFQTEDKFTEYRIEEYNWSFAAERADSLGVDVINSSLGYNEFDDPSMNYTVFDLTGKKAVVSITARKAVEKGMLVITSAGNEGNNNFWKLVTMPADADGVMAVGAVTSLGAKSSFSSIGPTADGRIKPEVVALGSGTSVIRSNGTVGAASGTSLASPLVASLAAGLIQAYPTASPNLIFNSILYSGSIANSPTNLLGNGIPNFLIAKNYFISSNDPVSIFPNPLTSQFLNVLFKEAKGEIVNISIYDLIGRMLYSGATPISFENNPLRYDLSLLANGIYLVDVNSDKVKITVKLVKAD